MACDQRAASLRRGPSAGGSARRGIRFISRIELAQNVMSGFAVGTPIADGDFNDHASVFLSERLDVRPHCCYRGYHFGYHVGHGVIKYPV